MKRIIGKVLIIILIISISMPVISLEPVIAQDETALGNLQTVAIQTAVISEEYGYLNLESRGGRPLNILGPPPLQEASMTATFANFELNGIPFDNWQACRANKSVDECLLEELDPNGDGGLRALHPGEIGGDTFTFDITITNTSEPGGPVLTTFAFQSKFSESPALGSRIGDKLFSARRFGDVVSEAEHSLIGVKKNGTTNGLFGGKIKGICINSSDDYPSELNLGIENETLECTGGRTFNYDTNWPVLQAADYSFIDEGNIKLPKG